MNTNDRQKRIYVQNMFSRIASRYDLMNRVMTGGQDIVWRKLVIDKAKLSPRAAVLDLGTGTGDLLFEAQQRCPDCIGIGGDFTLEMMLVGREKPGRASIRWVGMDAQQLPLKDATFDVVISGFLLRNVIDLEQVLREQYRVLKPGGIVIALDTTRPPEGILAPILRGYLRWVIPFLGRLMTGQADAYHYLPETTAGFLRAEELAARFALVGFSNVSYVKRMFGVIAIHWARKKV